MPSPPSCPYSIPARTPSIRSMRKCQTRRIAGMISRPSDAWRQRVGGKRGLATELRVSGLDAVIDDRDALVVAKERALHRVDRQPLDVLEGETERGGEPSELLRERDRAHQPVVRVHRDAELLLEEVAD